MDKRSSPSLLPILRSQQQGEVLALVLGDAGQEWSITQIAQATAVAYASVHREIERAELAGLVASRRIGNTRLVRANVASPYFAGLSDILVKAFGPPRLLASALAAVESVAAAFIYGSWAAGATGESGPRPVADIDLLVLGEPDRDRLYAVVEPVEARLGRQVQVTIRPADWLETGTGSFHDTVTSRPMVRLEVTRNGQTVRPG